MKYLDEYRDPRLALGLSQAIKKQASGNWMIMEVCGGQTHSILKYGIDELLPENIRLVHGPGCPVCVTPVELIDQAILLAKKQDLIFCSFGDMLRVPGSGREDLFSAKALGADVRVVYSPLDCLRIAQEYPEQEVVFFAVGFETTAPANAMLALQAHKLGLKNISLLVSHVLVPPALKAILDAPGCKVQGFLAPGHVCTVMGYENEYQEIATRYRVPIVVTGFEPLDILKGILSLITQLEEGRYEVENDYSRSVKAAGNPHALTVVREVFEVISRKWRGVGEIPESGFGLRKKYEHLDAGKKYQLQNLKVREDERCRMGQILQGRLRPDECEMYGRVCTPGNPLGATMVSSEGACAAYFKYRDRHRDQDRTHP